MVHVNGKKVGGNDAVTKFTAYVSPYFVVSNGGAYTKHIYAASQRIASKLGNEDGFGADPRRVEQAGGKKYSDIQKDNIGARFSELGFAYTAPEKEKEEKDSTMDSEEEEKLIFFYHPDHLGSTSYVTDADGNIAQHVEYIPYGEIFVEERNSQFSTNFLFNAKELDNETGLYYYGARYLDPTGAMWLSVDPLFEKYAGMSPYNYCAGNPVKMVDPDGREIDETSMTEHNNLKETIVSTKNNLIEQRKGLDPGSEGYSELSSRIDKLSEAFDNLTAMEKSDKIFKYKAVKDDKTDFVEITQSIENFKKNIYELSYAEGDIENMIHEVAIHGGQFVNGDLYYQEEGGVLRRKVGNNKTIDDIEVSAYQAQYALSGRLKYYIRPPQGTVEAMLNTQSKTWNTEGQYNQKNFVHKYNEINKTLIRSMLPAVGITPYYTDPLFHR